MSTAKQNKTKQNKTKPRRIVGLAVLVDHRVKLKESEKRDKYLDLARELKKLWDVKVTVIPIIIGTFGTIPKGLVKGLEDLLIRGQVETILTTGLLKSDRILKRVLEILGDYQKSNHNNQIEHLIWAKRSDLVGVD